MKKFNSKSWNDCLALKDWSILDDCSNVNETERAFTELINEALNETAAFKTFKVRSSYKFGLSAATKELMKNRDQTRKAIKSAGNQEKLILQKKYKLLRNKVTTQIRKENIEHNNNRVEEAKTESELWKITKEVTESKSENGWKININEVPTDDESIIAESFNTYFIEKIENLKQNIDNVYKEDPFPKLKQKLKYIKSKFKLKKITQKQMAKTIKTIKKKKSAGIDGLSQEQLIMGASILTAPLTSLINKSIEEGVFPTNWKEALVTPIHKKGDKQTISNYRPVSCLPAASKLLESVVCKQVSEYMEGNELLPNNQHGFRPRRSTMTAWANIQQEWALNSEKEETTGVLLWDLSAAFDTLDPMILCKKLEIYGFDQNAVKWFNSYLTNRSQRVKIGNKTSSSRKLMSGVPQGGVLSPLVFVMYVSDLEDWLDGSDSITYADDTTTFTSGPDLGEIISRMEKDAENVLKYMASNGLIANPNKTSLLFLNQKSNVENQITIRIGNDVITQERSAKLLGMTFDQDQQWKSQIYGKSGLVSSLNSRLFIIKRLGNHLKGEALLKVIDGLFTSKIRYGLQLLGRVRLRESDPVNQDLQAIQKIQNKLLRHLNHSRLKDKIRTSDLLEKFKMLSINQLNAQIKLTEMWKAINLQNYPIKVSKQIIPNLGSTTRATTYGRLIEPGTKTKTIKTCISDSTRIWNKAPTVIKLCTTLHLAKIEIKKFLKSIPI